MCRADKTLVDSNSHSDVREIQLARFHFRCTCKVCTLALDTYGVFLQTMNQESLDSDAGRYLWDYEGMLRFARQSSDALPDLLVEEVQQALLAITADPEVDVPKVMKPIIQRLNLESHKRIANYPFPDILEAFFTFYNVRDLYGPATILLCGKLSLCQSYQHPEKTHPSKVATYVALSRLLRVTFVDRTGPYSLNTIARKLGLDYTVVEELKDSPTMFKTSFALLILAQMYVGSSHGINSKFATMLSTEIEELRGDWQFEKDGVVKKHFAVHIPDVDFGNFAGDTNFFRPMFDRLRRLGSFENVLKVLMM